MNYPKVLDKVLDSFDGEDPTTISPPVGAVVPLHRRPQPHQTFASGSHDMTMSDSEETDPQAVAPIFEPTTVPGIRPVARPVAPRVGGPIGTLPGASTRPEPRHPGMPLSRNVQPAKPSAPQRSIQPAIPSVHQQFAAPPASPVASSHFPMPTTTHHPASPGGQAYEVPANPLGDLSDVALEGFIECTLTEGFSPPAVEPMLAPVESAFVPAQSTQAVVPVPVATPSSSNKLLLVVSALAVAVGLGVAAGLVLIKSTQGAAPIPTPVVLAPAAAPAPAAVPVAAGPAVAEPAAPPLPAEPAQEPSAVNAAALPTGLKCALTVTSKPDRAEVVVDGEVLGKTPFKGEVDCATTALELRKTSYQVRELSLDLDPEEASSMQVDLHRPVHELAITSKPAGAEIWINGEKLEESTPATVSVAGFEPTTVEVKRKGFKSWSDTVTTEAESTSVMARLERGRDRSTKKSQRARKRPAPETRAEDKPKKSGGASSWIDL